MPELPDVEAYRRLAEPCVGRVVRRAVPAGAQFDRDAAAHDVGKETVERFRALADVCLDHRRNGHIVKHDP